MSQQLRVRSRATAASIEPFDDAEGVIENARKNTYNEAMALFQHIDTQNREPNLQDFHLRPDLEETLQTLTIRFRGCLSSILGDAPTLYRVVDGVMWDVLEMSARVAAHHDAAVQARVDTTTATVLMILYPFKPMMTLKDNESLLYRCVRETDHVFGPDTLAVIALRADQCFRENELLDSEAIASFEQRYHHRVLDGYTARTCREPAAVQARGSMFPRSAAMPRAATAAVLGTYSSSQKTSLSRHLQLT